MSRKNKNGGRRNYTPKTYGRDFLLSLIHI